MGTYGIGTSRILATVVEQHRDDKGIRWPRETAPLPVHVMVLSPDRSDQAEAAARFEQELAGGGLEVLFDEREASPGVKFNDADLIGLPVQVVFGKKVADGMADIKIRYSGERRDVAVDAAAGEVVRSLGEVP